MIKKQFLDRIKSEILLADGAWGTQLQSFGLKPGECPELWNIDQAKKVSMVAESYVKAGADIIETNSFGGSKIKLGEYGLQERCYELNKRAAEISREAAADKVIVFGSIGPTGKFLMTGEVLSDQMYESFLEQCTGLKAGGVNAFCIETFYDLQEAGIAIKAAKECGDLPVIVSFTFQKTGDADYNTIMGKSPEELVAEISKHNLTVLGTNCGNGITDMVEIVSKIKTANPNVPVLVQANAGLPELKDNGLVYSESAQLFRENVRKLVDAGASIIGGCCGTTPEYIAEMRKEVDNINLERRGADY